MSTRDLVFRLPADDVPSLLTELGSDPALAPQVIRSAGAAGGGEIATVLVQLGPPVLTFLAGVVATWVARPRASIEIDGIKVTGASRNVVEQILRERVLSKSTGQDTAGQSVNGNGAS
jgi:hypothetical protein